MAFRVEMPRGETPPLYACGFSGIFISLGKGWGPSLWFYLMSYKPAEVADGRWRKIDILVSGNESYKLRAKQGYFPQ